MRLEESKWHPFLQEPQEVGFRELQFSQLHLSLGGGDEVNDPGNVFHI